MACKFPPRQARRRFLLILGGSAFVALAACQTGPGPGPGARPVIGPSGEVEAARHLVAVIVPLSGPDSGVGQSIANAANLALADTGEKSLRLSSYDSAGPGGAAAAVRHALADGAGLVLGPLLAEDVRAVAPLARQAGVPVIAYSNDEGVAGDGVYVMGFTPAQSIDRVVGYARGKGITRYSAMVPTGLYGQRASQAVLSSVRSAGGRVMAMETFARNASAVKGAASRLRGKGGAEAVLIADAGRIASLAAPSLGKTQLLGTELWASDRGLGQTPALRGAFYAAAPDARFAQLSSRYRAHYGRSPYRLASLGYDSVLLAARAAKSWRAGRAFPAGSLVDKDGFAGVDGTFRFGRNGIAERLLEVRQVTAGGTTVVSKASSVF